MSYAEQKMIYIAALEWEQGAYQDLAEPHHLVGLHAVQSSPLRRYASCSLNTRSMPTFAIRSFSLGDFASNRLQNCPRMMKMRRRNRPGNASNLPLLGCLYPWVQTPFFQRKSNIIAKITHQIVGKYLGEVNIMLFLGIELNITKSLHRSLPFRAGNGLKCMIESNIKNV